MRRRRVWEPAIQGICGDMNKARNQHMIAETWNIVNIDRLLVALILGGMRRLRDRYFKSISFQIVEYIYPSCTNTTNTRSDEF